jgi:acid phosphatase family membrane protein YuiD
MEGLYYVLPALLIVFISILVVRAAGIALMMTGLEEHLAKLQALSAFTGTGFTTREAEFIVNHPRRRKIITWLMILGNAGFVSVIVTIASTFFYSQGYQISYNAILLFVGLIVLYKIASSKVLSGYWERFIERKLAHTKFFEEAPTESLLHLLEGYGLVKVFVSEAPHLVGIRIANLEFTRKNLLVLGIERESGWIPVPSPEVEIGEDDRLIVYGPLEVLEESFSKSPP